MTKSELHEMEHIKQLLAKLQTAQLTTFGDSSINMDIDTGGYKHSIHVTVYAGKSVMSVGGFENARREEFVITPWQASRHNTNICNGCIAFVNAHRERKP